MSPRAFTILCAAAIALTLPLKIAAGTAREPRAPELLQERLSAFLVREGFHLLPHAESAGPFVPAVAEGCRLGIAEALPQGWNSDGLRLSASGSRLFFVYDGSIYAEPPTRRTAIRYQWTRLMRALGADTPWKPSLAVTASHGCDAESLPWAELATVE
jgi:hypothetical protein